ncbi:MAG: helix-turn-helix transcriptional regulator [Pseudomonadota bacterium]
MFKIAPHTHYESFRTMLQVRRKAAGLTQAALGKKLGWTQSIVAKIENGERRLDVVEYFIVASAIGFDALEALQEYQNSIEP